MSSIIILGNGGASKSVLYQCAKSKINEITLVARDHAKSMALCKRLEETFNINIKKLSFLSLNKKKVRAADIIVNTTSVGMNNQGDSFSLIEDMLKGQIFYDLIYSPWETKMMQVCKSKGIDVINGAPMLAHQGALAFKHFFGKTPDTDTMLKLLSSNRG